MRNLFTSFSSRHYAAGLIIGLLLYIGAAEIVLRTYVVSNHKPARNAVSIYASKNKDIIIGDSHTQNAFKSESPSFTNLSMGGISVEMMEILIKEYYRNRDPHRVIIIASPQMFAQNRIEKGNWGYNKYFKFNMLNPPFMLYVFEKAVSSNLAIIPDLFKRKKDDLVEWEKAGKDDRERRTSARIKEQRPVINFKQTKSFASYLRTLSFLKEKGADVCLLRTPVSQEYQEMTSDDNGFKSADDAFKKMAAQYGFKYVDFKQLPITYDDTIFVNQDHLNSKGSKIFAPLAEKYCFEKILAAER